MNPAPIRHRALFAAGLDGYNGLTAANMAPRIGGSMSVALRLNPALGLIGVYVIVTGLLQVGGFAVSRLVEAVEPTFGLMTFLVLYLGMFWVGWPIAVRIAEALIPGVRSDSPKSATGV